MNEKSAEETQHCASFEVAAVDTLRDVGETLTVRVTWTSTRKNHTRISSVKCAPCGTKMSVSMVQLAFECPTCAFVVAQRDVEHVVYMQGPEEIAASEKTSVREWERRLEEADKTFKGQEWRKAGEAVAFRKRAETAGWAWVRVVMPRPKSDDSVSFCSLEREFGSADVSHAIAAGVDQWRTPHPSGQLGSCVYACTPCLEKHLAEPKEGPFAKIKWVTKEEIRELQEQGVYKKPPMTMTEASLASGARSLKAAERQQLLDLWNLTAGATVFHGGNRSGKTHLTQEFAEKLLEAYGVSPDALGPDPKAPWAHPKPLGVQVAIDNIPDWRMATPRLAPYAEQWMADMLARCCAVVSRAKREWPKCKPHDRRLALHFATPEEPSEVDVLGWCPDCVGWAHEGGPR